MATRRALSTALATVAIWLVPAATALATDRYVDDQGAGMSPCTTVTNPCAQISTAIGASSSGDVIHVGGTATNYAGNLSLPNGVSLIKDSFASGPGIVTTGTATINTTANTNPAVTVAAGTAARTISGFTLRGGNLGGNASVVVADNTSNLTISGNVFDDNSASVASHLRFNGGGTMHINGNSFVGEDDDVVRRGIAYGADESGSIEIGGNSISDLFYPIQISGPTPPATTVDIHDNQITDVYDDGAGGAIPFGMDLSRVTGQITDNVITQIPGQPSGGGTLTFTGTPATGTPLQVARNQVYGFASYSQFSGDELVVLTDDVFGNNGVGLGLFNTTATATGITATGGSGIGEIYVSTANLTLDSSIVGPLGVALTIGSTCSSTFSATTDPTPSCGLAGGANPMFANAAGNDFSLLQGSSLIDAGNPAAPAAGETDVLGANRAVPALTCTERRDIGAHEFPQARDCTAPNTTISGRKKLKTRKKKARGTFTLTSTKPGSTFECRVDSRPFAPCASRFTTKLRIGKHVIEARSTDTNGNVGAPAAFPVKVKRKRPPR